jgi:hypothetical protein
MWCKVRWIAVDKRWMAVPKRWMGSISPNGQGMATPRLEHLSGGVSIVVGVLQLHGTTSVERYLKFDGPVQVAHP